MSIKVKQIGRPPMFKTAKELQAAIEDYFKNGVKTRKVVVGKGDKQKTINIPIVTITGLVLHCGFADRRSFYEYEKKPMFSHTIKTARTLIEQEYEEQLHNGNPGAIFALKNFGWTDKLDLGNNPDNPLLTKLQVEFTDAKCKEEKGK